MPPIFLKEYAWSQTDSNIFISLSLPNRIPKFDVSHHDSYLKVNAAPYIFELFLKGEIQYKESRIAIIGNKMMIELKKKSPGQWNELENIYTGMEKVQKRREILEMIHNDAKIDKEGRETMKISLKQASVQEQIGFDAKNRSAVESIKNDEKIRVTHAIEEFRKIKNSVPEEHEPARKNFPMPLVRKNGAIKVQFSNREFPTPTRESLYEEEKEFLSKQLNARRAAGFVSEDLRPEECNPIWLKNKGDSFFNDKNYLGAISAYSHAIKLGAKMSELYSNRAACHKELGNLHKALEDISTALELLTPPVEANRKARAKCFARRAVILCHLGLPKKSLPEFEEALKLRPEDKHLRSDYERAKALAEEEESDN